MTRRAKAAVAVLANVSEHGWPSTEDELEVWDDLITLAAGGEL